METADSSETSVHFYQSTGRDITADGKDENLKSHNNRVPQE